jgi:hypothetical protein
MEGRNYLFAIAIDRYTYYPSLNNAVKDVEEIIRILTELYQFEKDCILTLFNEDATEDNIDAKFLELVDLVGEKDNLIVFYSGHGYYRDNVKEGYWIPSNGMEDKVTDFITNANLINYLRNVKSHHLLMVVDSCFSGALVEKLRGNTTSEKLPSRRVFASGRTETVSDGLPGQNSPFAKGIIDALKANSGPPLTTTKLIREVKEYVSRVSRQEPVEGRLRDSIDNRGEFVFYRKLTELEYWNVAKERNTLESYESFLKIYQEGEYSAKARIKRLECLALKAWNKTIESDTIPDYEDFLILHGSSRHVDQAKERIEQLKRAELEQREAERKRGERLKAQAKEEEEIDNQRELYRKKRIQGKEAFKAGDYRLARKLFGECEILFRKDTEGFIPGIEKIQEEKQRCTQELMFAEYLQDGKRAYDIRAYKSAIELFHRALQNKPGNLEAQKLKEAAEKLINTAGHVDVHKGGTERPHIVVRSKKPDKINQVPGRTSPRERIKVVPGGHRTKSAATKSPPGQPRNILGKRTIARNQPGRDFTYPLIALLILIYFVLLKFLGIIG